MVKWTSKNIGEQFVVYPDSVKHVHVYERIVVGLMSKFSLKFSLPANNDICSLEGVEYVPGEDGTITYIASSRIRPEVIPVQGVNNLIKLLREANARNKSPDSIFDEYRVRSVRLQKYEWSYPGRNRSRGYGLYLINVEVMV